MIPLRLNHEERDIFACQSRGAIGLPISRIVHVANPHGQIKLQLALNVVHVKPVEFGIVQSVRKRRGNLLECHCEHLPFCVG